MFVRFKEATREIEVYENAARRWTWRTRSRANRQITGNAAEDFDSKFNAMRAAKAEARETGRKIVVLEDE